jgi:hypothetical protein
MATRGAISVSIFAIAAVAAGFAVRGDVGDQQAGAHQNRFDQTISRNADEMLEEGRKTFRFDTFGDEEFWGGTLQLHRAIAGQRLGGVGPGVSPSAALKLGLKVDVDALPRPVVNALRQQRWISTIPPRRSCCSS